MATTDGMELNRPSRGLKLDIDRLKLLDAASAFELLRDDLSPDTIQAEVRYFSFLTRSDVLELMCARMQLQKLLDPEDLDAVKADVEKRFLIPQTTFPYSWLGACQQYVKL